MISYGMDEAAVGRPAAVKVLMAHAYFRQRGGEDCSFESEARLLQNHGHTVTPFIRDNRALSTDQLGDRIRTARDTVWSSQAADDLAKVLERERPDVVHFQNVFPSLSPSAIAAAADRGFPVVYSLRNYRMACPMGQFFRDGGVCEDCLGRRIAVPGIVHGCYRGSRALTTLVASMSALARTRGVWNGVTTFIALSQFVRKKFIEIGLPPERIVVKPNFVLPDPGEGEAERRGNHILFVGRLSQEKGVTQLLEALIRTPELPLQIMGTGPLEGQLRSQAKRARLHVTFLGQGSSQQVSQAMQEARAVVVPSQWDETFGRVVVEAFACGTPVIATRMGALEELVKPGSTGALVPAGDRKRLAGALHDVLSRPADWEAMGRRARLEFERRYTAEANYRQVMEIYHAAIRTT